MSTQILQQIPFRTKFENPKNATKEEKKRTKKNWNDEVPDLG